MRLMPRPVDARHRSLLAAAVGLALCQSAWAQQATELAPIIVTDEAPLDFGTTVDGKALDARRYATNDTATLLGDLPGVSLYSGGGISSLPVINGLADDRLKITVDGMSITSACPNHMNPALSYIDPAALSRINVYAGIVPVSQGGDSIGGAIAVKSLPPSFAQPGQHLKTSAILTAFHRGNGSVNSVSAQAYVASEALSVGYVGNTTDAGNYEDGSGHVVVASRYKVRNNSLKLAANSGGGLWTVAIGWQDIPFQGYPNQSMDMTSNKSLSINAAYSGNYHWGALEARIYRQHVRHKMDVLQDKAAAAGFPFAESYMPMETDAVDLGYSILGTVPLGAKRIARFGHEMHLYTLDDWWPPLAGSMAMGPNTFWNINDGRRARLALFSELDSDASDRVSTQLGARVEHVAMDTGRVQGYYDASAPFGDAYETDAAAFNARDHKRNDLNVDLTASARYLASEHATYDIGVSRKTRSPNLHERYTWANEAMMAGLMNNWFGDLNSYVGNLDLSPEVAYSVKAGADWHDSHEKGAQLTVAPFFTYVKDYINAVPNTSTNPYNMSGLMGRQSLTFANQDARLYGVDVSARKLLGEFRGSWTVRATLDYTRGTTSDGDNLYNIMPLNARLAIDHAIGPWSSSLEAVIVGAKGKLSAVRAEQATAGYSLVNFRTSYSFGKSFRLDAGLDNAFNRQYDLPLGGLEYVSGGMMGAPRPLRAMGRSINIGLTFSY